MLITACTHCQARFRVTPQQLNVRQGQVRCGRCAQVFNGFQSLERFPDDDTGTRLLAAREAEERADGMPQVEAIREPPPIEEAASAGAESPAPGPGETGPHEASPPPEPASSHDLREPRGPRERHAARNHPPASPLESQPGRASAVGSEQVLTLTPPPREPPARAWQFGVALLLLVLVVELAYMYRGRLAQKYPVARPVIESVCARLGCTVPWSREEALLRLEDSELLEVPGKAGEIALGARIRNLASVAQEYPHLELTLTDLSGQPAIRRVLRPADYLGRAPGQGEVIPAGVEVAVQLRLQTPRLRATGYELLLFYP